MGLIRWKLHSPSKVSFLFQMSDMSHLFRLFDNTQTLLDTLTKSISPVVTDSRDRRRTKLEKKFRKGAISKSEVTQRLWSYLYEVCGAKELECCPQTEHSKSPSHFLLLNQITCIQNGCWRAWDAPFYFHYSECGQEVCSTNVPWKPIRYTASK